MCPWRTGKNMVYMGSTVVIMAAAAWWSPRPHGYGEGKIADALANAQEGQTPPCSGS